MLLKSIRLKIQLMLHPLLKSFFVRFLIAFVFAASFYFTIYRLPRQIVTESRKQEKLALSNMQDKLAQIIRLSEELGDYNSIKEDDFIHSIDLYRERAVNALALSNEVGSVSEALARDHNSGRELLFAAARLFPRQDPIVLERPSYPDGLFIQSRDGLKNIDSALAYALDNQKALKNLFEYIPELDFRGLSVGNGRTHFIDRLDRANTGLAKIVERLAALPADIKNTDDTLKNIISEIESLRQSVAALKNAVIAGNGKTSESLKADFILQVRFAQRKIVKNRIGFLKNYLEKNNILKNLRTYRSEINGVLAGL